MSEDTVTVRVAGRQFRHDGEEYHHGDVLDVPERALQGWPRRLERVEEAESGSSGDAEPDATDGSSDGDGADEADSESDEDEADEEPESEDESEGVAEPPFNPSELTVPEIEDELDAGDFSDAELAALYSAEAEAGERTTALEAIDDALEG
jgi:hypothetical protein